MPPGTDADDVEDVEDDPPPRPTLRERLRGAVLKPEDPNKVTAAPAQATSVEEIEAEAATITDKERLVGLLGAPIGAAIGFLIINDLVNHDPVSGKNHVAVSFYHELFLLIVGFSVLMVIMALLRKRLYLGIVSAFYGLAIFNLHYWGFGLPFIAAGAWLLTHAYRINQRLKEANGGRRPGAVRRGPAEPGSSRPPSNKRYTPPTKRTSRAKPTGDPPENEKKAG